MQKQLSQKQIAIIEKNAPEVIKLCARAGKVEPALLWLDAFFWELDLKKRYKDLP